MNRTFQYVATALLLALTATRSSAQTPTSEEQLQEVVVLGKQKQKTLLRRGTRIPGAIVMLTPDQVGHEVGSALTLNHATELKEITLDIVSNSIAEATLSIMIYRDSTCTEVLESPLIAHIPQGKKQTITVTPEKPLLLEQGRYIIAVSFADCAKETRVQWILSDQWTDKQRYDMVQQCCMQFPLYSKMGYMRIDATDTFEKRNLNIGLKVKGIESK
ncbi:MAG: hypothetical protein IJA98_06355 [Bacteroidaceae bacterium]|nr:hypothetical protein [Bacteroidaceae bacterium]